MHRRKWGLESSDKTPSCTPPFLRVNRCEAEKGEGCPRLPEASHTPVSLSSGPPTALTAQVLVLPLAFTQE